MDPFAGELFEPVDPIAERIEAYSRLLSTLTEVKSQRLLREGLAMLEAVRRGLDKELAPEGKVVSLVRSSH